MNNSEKKNDKSNEKVSEKKNTKKTKGVASGGKNTVSRAKKMITEKTREIGDMVGAGCKAGNGAARPRLHAPRAARA